MQQTTFTKTTMGQGGHTRFRRHQDDHGGRRLERARTMAMLSRSEAAALLGIEIQRYTKAEARGEDTELAAAWIAKLSEQHTGIEVRADIEQTPKSVRELRLSAGLTKSEAASVVGLDSGLGWHAYELGRYLMPSERWASLLDHLRSGEFRKHVTSAYRRGPKLHPGFEAGRMYSSKRPSSVTDKSQCGRFEISRKALRLSGSEMAEVISAKSAARIYNIEALRTAPNEVEIMLVGRALNARLLELYGLRSQLKLLSGQEIAVARKSLRLSQDDAGRFLFEDSARPGASISLYESGVGTPGREKLSVLSKAFARERNSQATAIQGIVDTFRVQKQ